MVHKNFLLLKNRLYKRGYQLRSGLWRDRVTSSSSSKRAPQRTLDDMAVLSRLHPQTSQDRYNKVLVEVPMILLYLFFWPSFTASYGSWSPLTLAVVKLPYMFHFAISWIYKKNTTYSMSCFLSFNAVSS